MKCKEVMKLLGCHRVTLNKYIRLGTIRGTMLENGRYDYNEEDVYRMVGRKLNYEQDKKIVSYSRVSTSKQKDQLVSQTTRIYDSCICRNLILEHQYEDIGSGMNFDRKNFNDLIKEVIKGKIKIVVIENKDRLVRFGFELLETLFKYYGTKIIVLNDVLDNKSYEMEMTEDLISIIHYFTMKNYSHRRKLNKLRREIEQE